MAQCVVLCRGDLNEAELEVLGPFDDRVTAEEWVESMEFADTCPNEHEVQEIRPIRD